jgi:hypothetical protein
MIACATLIVAGSMSSPVRAQVFGNGNRGGGGGIGPGSTVYGDAARGAGIMAMGMGQYNLTTAMAHSINTDTAMRWNEYVYQSIQIDLHKKYLHRVAHQERGKANYNAIKKRMRDNPEPADVVNGDALNSVLLQLWDPAISPSNYRRTVVPIPGDTIRKIPFNYASRGATFSMDRLIGKQEWPLAFEGAKFANVRKKYEKAIDSAINQDVEGKLTTDAVRVVEVAIEDLELKVEQEIPQSHLQDWNQARNYIKKLKEVPKMLRERTVEQAIAAIETYPGTSVGELILFMQKHGLRFGVADTPEERTLYTSLLENLRQLRDQVGIPPEKEDVK